MEEVGGTDSILTMFAKFQSSHLTEEGLAILKSMADSIRSALEKGMVLEQMLIEQKSKKIEKSKKKNKKRKSSPDGSICESYLTDEKGLTAKVNNKTDEFVNSLQNSNFPENKPVVLNDMPTPFVESKVKLVDQSLLLKDSVNLSQTQNETVLANCYQCATCSHIRPPNPTNCDAILNVSNAFVHSNDKLNYVNSFSSSLIYASNSADESASGLLIPKEEPMNNTENDTSAVTPPPTTTNNLNKSATLQSPQISKSNLSLQNVDENPVMPCPIVVKAEPIQDKSPDAFIPCDLVLNINANVEQSEDTTETNVTPKSISHTTSEPNQSIEENPMHYSSTTLKEYKVFIKTGRRASEEEVLSIFKDLEVTYCKVISRPVRSFGFISFSTEEHMMKAIRLSNKFAIGGKKLVVQKCLERKKRNRESMSWQDSRRYSQSHGDAKKVGRFSNDSDRGNKITSNCSTPINSNYRGDKQSTENFPKSTSDCENSYTRRSSFYRRDSASAPRSLGRDKEAKSPFRSGDNGVDRSYCDDGVTNEPPENQLNRETNFRNDKNFQPRLKTFNRLRSFNNSRRPPNRSWSYNDRPYSTSSRGRKSFPKPNLGSRSQK